MTTINISLPDKLKDQADALITEGHYASFSDLVRTSLRQIIFDRRLDRLVTEAKHESKTGKSIVLKTDEDVNKFFAKYIPK
jgi:Arc/MetJ-type ribon-helix-helix transcriptional regulator